MKTATTLYSNVFRVLTSIHETPAVSEAKEHILRSVSGSDAQVDEDVEAGVASENDMERVTVQFADAKTLRNRSPYTAVFESCIANVTASEDEEEHVENSTRSLQCFQIIKEVMHLYPMWSSMFQGNVDRFAAGLVKYCTLRK